MKKTTTYEEYREEIVKKFREEHTEHYPKEVIGNFIKNYEDEILDDYKTKTELIKDGMRDGYDTSGLAYIMDLEI